MGNYRCYRQLESERRRLFEWDPCLKTACQKHLQGTRNHQTGGVGIYYWTKPQNYCGGSGHYSHHVWFQCIRCSCFLELVLGDSVE